MSERSNRSAWPRSSPSPWAFSPRPIWSTTGPFSRIVSNVVDAMTGSPAIIAGFFVYILWVVPQKEPVRPDRGGARLGVMMLPIVTRASQEVIAIVPGSLKEAALRSVHPGGVPCSGHAPDSPGGPDHRHDPGHRAHRGGDRTRPLHRGGNARYNWNPFSGKQDDLPLRIYQMIFHGKNIDRDAWGVAFVLVLSCSPSSSLLDSSARRNLGPAASPFRGGPRSPEEAGEQWGPSDRIKPTPQASSDKQGDIQDGEISPCLEINRQVDEHKVCRHATGVHCSPWSRCSPCPRARRGPLPGNDHDDCNGHLRASTSSSSTVSSSRALAGSDGNAQHTMKWASRATRFVGAELPQTAPAPINGTGSSFAAPAIETWVNRVARLRTACPSTTHLQLGHGPYDSPTRPPTLPWATWATWVTQTPRRRASRSTSSPSPQVASPSCTTCRTDEAVAAEFAPRAACSPVASRAGTTPISPPTIREWRLPNTPVIPVTESDSAGTNYVLEEWCIDEQPAFWADFVKPRNPSRVGSPTVWPSPLPHRTRTGRAFREDWTIRTRLRSRMTLDKHRSDRRGPGEIRGRSPVSAARPDQERRAGQERQRRLHGSHGGRRASALAYATQLPDGTHQLNFSGRSPRLQPVDLQLPVDSDDGMVVLQGRHHEPVRQLRAHVGAAARALLRLREPGPLLGAVRNQRGPTERAGASATDCGREPAYACGDLTPTEVAAGQTTPTCGVMNATAGRPGVMRARRRGLRFPGRRRPLRPVTASRVLVEGEAGAAARAVSTPLWHWREQPVWQERGSTSCRSSPSEWPSWWSGWSAADARSSGVSVRPREEAAERSSSSPFGTGRCSGRRWMGGAGRRGCRHRAGHPDRRRGRCRDHNQGTMTNRKVSKSWTVVSS